MKGKSLNKRDYEWIIDLFPSFLSLSCSFESSITFFLFSFSLSFLCLIFWHPDDRNARRHMKGERERERERERESSELFTSAETTYKVRMLKLSDTKGIFAYMNKSDQVDEHIDTGLEHGNNMRQGIRPSVRVSSGKRRGERQRQDIFTNEISKCPLLRKKNPFLWKWSMKWQWTAVKCSTSTWQVNRVWSRCFIHINFRIRVLYFSANDTKWNTSYDALRWKRKKASLKEKKERRRKPSRLSEVNKSPKRSLQMIPRAC